MRKILALLLAVTALIGGGAYLAGTASAGSGAAVLCAKVGSRDLKVFDVTCPAGYFSAQLPASAVSGGGSVASPTVTATATVTASPTACPDGFTLGDSVVPNAAKAGKVAADLEKDQAALKDAKDAATAAQAKVDAAQDVVDKATTATDLADAKVALAAAKTALAKAQAAVTKAQAAVDDDLADIARPATVTLHGCRR